LAQELKRFVFVGLLQPFKARTPTLANASFALNEVLIRVWAAYIVSTLRP
jgi:hypothetical protein